MDFPLKTARDLTVQFIINICLVGIKSRKTGHLIGYQWHRFISKTDKYRAVFVIPGNTETDVRVRVAGSVVQIQRQDASVAAIVPIATAKEGAQPTL